MPNVGPNRVVFVSENGVPYIYDIDNKEEYEFLKSRAVEDDDGNLVLSMPLLAAVKYTPTTVMNRISKLEKDENIPKIVMDFEPNDQILISDIYKYDNERLAECLSIYGGYKAYIESQLGYAEARMGILETGFEEGLNKALYKLEQSYAEDKVKKPNKESLRGEVLDNNSKLDSMCKQYMEAEALCAVLRGKLQACKSLYDTASRIVALRTLSKEVV